jgi:hypothetical protein
MSVRPILLISSCLLFAPLSSQAQITGSLACSLALPHASVQTVLDSSDAPDVRAKELVVLTKEHAAPAWENIARAKDIAASLSDIIAILVTAETDATRVGNAIQAAFVAGCTQPATSAASDITSAMRAAAGLPKPIPIQKASADADSAKPGSASSFGSGDRVEFLTNVPGFRNANDPTDAGYTASAGCELHVSGSDPTNSYVRGYFKKSRHFYNFYGVFISSKPAPGASSIVASDGASLAPDGTSSTSSTENIAVCAEQQGDGKKIKENTLYEIAGDKLATAPSHIQGWQAGVLVAPYKFHFSDLSTTGSASIGGYLGYNYGNPAFSLTPVGSVGLGAVPVPASTTTVKNPTPGATTTHTSLTVAGGVIFGIKKAGAFQVGLLTGIDWAGEGANYKYEGKPWLSLSFGTSLTGPSATTSK